MLVFQDGGFCNGPDPESIDEAQAMAAAHIDAYAAHLRARIAGQASPYEAAAWSLKLREAADYAGDDAACPTLAAEARVRGVSTAAVVERVLRKGAAFLQLESQIAGTSGRHRDAVDAFATLSEVLAYDWRDGWPSLP